MALGDEVSLGAARRWVQERLREGCVCPCCGQRAKIYRRKVSSGMVVDLARLWRKAGMEFTYTPRHINGGNLCKLRHWGLVERGPKRGVWGITEHGRVLHKARRVPRHALIFNNKFLGLDDSEFTGVVDALGDRFNYDELMSS